MKIIGPNNAAQMEEIFFKIIRGKANDTEIAIFTAYQEKLKKKEHLDLKKIIANFTSSHEDSY